jgi:hypothetical protein
MRYAVEIVRETDGATEVLHRANVETITPTAARREAHALLTIWKRKRANGFTIKNSNGDLVYAWESE